MRELTKQQKIKVIDEMILLLNQERFNEMPLCHAYHQVRRSFKYKIDKPFSSLIPRFRELNQAIESEIIRTYGAAYIRYDNWTDDRIDLLKKVKKQVKEVTNETKRCTYRINCKNKR